MFPRLDACDVTAEAIESLVGWMSDETRNPASQDNTRIPAGFTYLGQFIDHDITFDPTPLPEQRRDPHALVNFRTPRYDLDSLYGSGPLVQPYLYDWESKPKGARLLVGANVVDSGSADPLAAHDLPRNEQGRALIGDARNDENVILTQLHLLFIRFHNAVVDRVGDFDEAQQIVRWHYQWMVVHEFLEKIVGKPMADRVLVHRKYYRWKREPFIPVEFSGAAFRFGHSMVRPGYGVEKRPPNSPLPQQAIPLSQFLAGFTRLPEHLVIDWERFFKLPGVAREPQSSQRIDTAIVSPLFELPEGRGALPRLNLLRGLRLGLPSGQDVANAMEEFLLPKEALLLDDGLEPKVPESLLTATPLWFYILCEAASALGEKGRHLGPVGGRIVAEVLVGLLEGDPSSYLSMEPAWQPAEFGTDRDFTMADLVEFAPLPD